MTGGPREGISASIKETPQSPLAPPPWEIQLGRGCPQPRRGLTRTRPCCHPSLGFPGSRTVRSNCCSEGAQTSTQLPWQRRSHPCTLVPDAQLPACPRPRTLSPGQSCRPCQGRGAQSHPADAVRASPQETTTPAQHSVPTAALTQAPIPRGQALWSQQHSKDPSRFESGEGAQEARNTASAGGCRDSN